MPQRILTLITLFACAAAGSAQTGTERGDGRVEILNADEWVYDKLANGAQRLKGNVRFKHANAIMHCDSAHLFEDQRVDAFGRVSIEQGDSLRADADLLRYDGRQHMARLEGNVRLRDRTMDLSTPSLDYDLRNKRAAYHSGGRIQSHKDGNVLTSGNGLYLAGQRRFIFGQDVVLEHPEHRIESDTMHYDTGTGISAFFGPSTIMQGATVITTLSGTYDTRNERARFTRRTQVNSKGRLLEGDSLHYDRASGNGLAWGHVSIADSSGDMQVLGDEGRYNERDDRSMVTGRAELRLRMGADTLFVHGDTLFAAPDASGRRITARRHVRFFKQDLQGACDTLLYSDADSLIRMHHEPVLWNGADQITGDTIRIALKDGQAHRLHVRGQAFLLSRVDSARYDQVAGTTMMGYFVDNALDHLDVEGNARTVYFAREEKDGVEDVFGVNRADCSRIRVRLKDGGISAVTFLDRPDAVLYPIAKAPLEELRMAGANDRSTERPADRWAIFD
ncbi:MAG: hypothetical protein IPM46_10970 [Flavobacteriales bacterium]|nr:hypothetical protein [Flavobacteriales bacterium]